MLVVLRMVQDHATSSEWNVFVLKSICYWLLCCICWESKCKDVCSFRIYWSPDVVSCYYIPMLGTEISMCLEANKYLNK